MSPWIRFDLVETMSDPEMSVVLKLLKFSEETEISVAIKTDHADA